MTATRAQEIATFLADTPWAHAQADPLAADASFRRYTRLFDMQRGEQALLMDAPPDKEKKTPAFVAIDHALRSAGLSAPEIYKADVERGLVLLEDFGQASYTHVLKTAPEREMALYSAAGSIPEKLMGLTAPEVGRYDANALQTELDVFCDYWWPDQCGAAMPADVRAAFNAAWAAPLQRLDAAARAYPALTLRDFHVDNLFDLPTRHGAARVGLIDFQDAVIGHAAYDLVSLLQDVRRRVSPEVEQNVLAKVNAALGQPDFKTLYAFYGAQRAMKILGVFIRLDRLYNKPQYRQHLPRTWACVMMNMHDDALAPLKHWIEHYIPADLRRLTPTS